MLINHLMFTFETEGKFIIVFWLLLLRFCAMLYFKCFITGGESPRFFRPISFLPPSPLPRLLTLKPKTHCGDILIRRREEQMKQKRLLVSCINRGKTLKPWYLIYDPSAEDIFNKDVYIYGMKIHKTTLKLGKVTTLVGVKKNFFFFIS